MVARGSAWLAASWTSRSGTPGVEGSGDERVAEGVGSDALGDPGPSGDAAHDPTGRVTVDPPVVGSDEDRPFSAFADRHVDGAGSPGRKGDGDDLAPFAQDRERAVAALQPKVLDVRRWLRRLVVR
jgi:hypothetical protein